METIQLLLAAALMLAVGVGMAAYERSRLKAKRPLFEGKQVVTLYWCAYLALFVMGVTTALAAAVR
jgi:divalent metal cation (Fe/Co/Zn/Cd) transporter